MDVGMSCGILIIRVCCVMIILRIKVCIYVRRGCVLIS